MTQPDDVLHASELYQEWLTALRDRALLGSHHQAQAQFRAVLLTLRRFMSTEAVLAFADGLPPLPRGIFLERWRPADPESLSSAEAFVAAVRSVREPHNVAPEEVAAEVLGIIAGHTDPHWQIVMRAQLPTVLRPLFVAEEGSRRY